MLSYLGASSCFIWNFTVTQGDISYVRINSSLRLRLWAVLPFLRSGRGCSNLCTSWNVYFQCFLNPLSKTFSKWFTECIHVRSCSSNFCNLAPGAFSRIVIEVRFLSSGEVVPLRNIIINYSKRSHYNYTT